MKRMSMTQWYIFSMNYSGFVAKLKYKAIHTLKAILKLFGLGITSFSNLSNLQQKALDTSDYDLKFVANIGKPEFELIFQLIPKSKAQLRQDIFALKESGFKRNGFFVEFGATNGISLSNTYMLEMEFSWSGILVEPARIWAKSLQKNRPNAIIETLCVWARSNDYLVFNEAYQPELSTIKAFSGLDHLKSARKAGKTYSVKTISLMDLLEKNRAPKYIDYLSIDTEGSEYEILRNFDFNQYTFGVISVEHNFTEQRGRIKNLLESFGYEQKFSEISMFDDWYVRKN
jgi:FkbM family methyltransferase